MGTKNACMPLTLLHTQLGAGSFWFRNTKKLRWRQAGQGQG